MTLRGKGKSCAFLCHRCLRQTKMASTGERCLFRLLTECRVCSFPLKRAAESINMPNYQKCKACQHVAGPAECRYMANAFMDKTDVLSKPVNEIIEVKKGKSKKKLFALHS